MPLLSSKLANGLKNMVPTDSESDAINAFADAWETYFMDASITGIALSGSLSAAKSAMKLALTGMSATGGGPAKIQAAIQAFWTAILPLGSSLWVLAPNAVVPPLVAPTTISALAPALLGTFASNTSGSLSKDDCAQQLALILHAQGGIGGIAIVQPPPPAPPAPMPIL